MKTLPGTRGLTLVELLFATMILTVASLTVLLLLPEAAQGQRSNRFKMVSAMHVQSLIEGYTNHGYDLAATQTRLFTGHGDHETGGAAFRGEDYIQTSKGSGNDRDITRTLRRTARLTGPNARYDLEQVMLTMGSGLYPLPTEIARRIDSPNDEISEILDQGGQIFYLEPNAARRFDIQARRESGNEAGQQNPLQRLLVGIVGDPVQNLAIADPLNEPLYELYPFPPRHTTNTQGLRLQLKRDFPWVQVSSRVIPAGTEYRGVILAEDLTIRSYRVEPTSKGTAAKWVPGSTASHYGWGHDLLWGKTGHASKHKPRRELWQTNTWEWGARIENFTKSDSDDQTALRDPGTRHANRWRAGLEHYRRLCNLHWNRIQHQVDWISEKASENPPKADKKRKIGERTYTVTITEPVIDPVTGDIQIGDDGLPKFTTREEQRTSDVVIAVDESDDIIELLSGGDPAVSVNRGWPTPPRGLGTATIQGSDIIEEDAVTGLDYWETTIRRSMPSLERRVMYRSAALALWASVACYDADGIVDITTALDTTKIYLDTDGDSQAEVWADANNDGILEQVDVRPNQTIAGYQGTTMVKRFLPLEANPLLTPWDELCFVRFTGNSSYVSVPIKDVLASMDQLTTDQIDSLLAGGGIGVWNQLVHPAQVYALAHVGHAAMMVTGYKRPFYDNQNSAEAEEHIEIKPARDAYTYVPVGEEWRLPFKATLPSYRIDRQLDVAAICDADHDLNGHQAGLYPGISRAALQIPQRFLAIRWRARSGGSEHDITDMAENHLLLDQATGEALLSPAYLAVHPPATGGPMLRGAADAEHDGSFDGPHTRDLFLAGGNPGSDGSADDLDGDGVEDLYLSLVDPRESLMLLHNPYHRLAWPAQSKLDRDNPDKAKNDNRGLHVLPGLDPDRAGVYDPADPATFWDIDDRVTETESLDFDDDGDLVDNEHHLIDIFNGTWGLASSATAACFPHRWAPEVDNDYWQPGQSANRRWPTAINGDSYDTDENLDLRGGAMVNELGTQSYLQWTHDVNCDGEADGIRDQGPIPFRPLTGPQINEFAPPYADAGAIDAAGYRRYQVVYHLRLDPGVDGRPAWSLQRVMTTPGDTSLADADIQFAHRAHESALRLGMGYTTQNPYDATVPRPLNAPQMMARPLASQDLFDANGKARRPANYGQSLHEQWYPLTSPTTGPIRHGAPVARTEWCGYLTEWNGVYSSTDQADSFAAYPADLNPPYAKNDGSQIWGRTLNIHWDDLPVLGERFGPGAPFIFGSPPIHPDDEVSGATNYRIVRDSDGDHTADLRTGRTKNSWDAEIYLNDADTQDREPGGDIPAWNFYRWPRKYNHWANRLHGHDDGNASHAWQTRTKRPERFHQTRRFDAASRARQIVYWVANWQAYEDAESAPGAPVDISRLPTAAGQTVATLTAQGKIKLPKDDDDKEVADITVVPFPNEISPFDPVVIEIAGYTLNFEALHNIKPPTFRCQALGVEYPPGVEPPPATDPPTGAHSILRDLLATGETALIRFPTNASRWVGGDKRLPVGHPERNLAWMDPERTATRWKWNEDDVSTLSVAGGLRIIMPHGHGAIPLASTQRQFGQNRITTKSLAQIPIHNLVPFGADRDGNGTLSNGDLSRSKRISAEVIARYVYYDPTMWLSPGR